MTKKDLKNGAIVKLRNDDFYLKIDNTLVEIRLDYDDETVILTGEFMILNEYNEDLTYKGDDSWSIIKVDNDVENRSDLCNKAISNFVSNGEKKLQKFKRLKS